MSTSLPIVEGTSDDEVKTFVNSRVSERVIDEVDVAVTDVLIAEHAKRQEDQRRIADLEGQLANSERRRLELERGAQFGSPMRPVFARPSVPYGSPSVSATVTTPEIIDIRESLQILNAKVNAMGSGDQRQPDRRASGVSPVSSEVCIRIPPPPGFTGLDQLVTPSWLTSVRVYFDAIGKSPELNPKWCIGYAATRLTEDAILWYQKEWLVAHPRNSNAAGTWIEFETEILDFFQPFIGIINCAK
jgi:hypothetical protein